MQHPVGYVLRNGRAELDDFLAILTQPYAWNEFIHTIFGSWMLCGFFVMAVSSYHLLRGREKDFFTRSFKIGAAFGLIFSIAVAVQGDRSAKLVSDVQPTKLAAMESLWETRKGAPMYLLAAPNPFGEGNLVELFPIPGALSFLAFGSFDAEVKGLNDFPKEDRPPVLITFTAFRLMVGLGALFIVLAALAWLWRNKLEERPWFLKTLIWTIPLPYIALWAGWTVAEVGRQPWIVYGLMRTSDAVSPVEASQVAWSLTAFLVVYGVLGAIGLHLLKKHAQKGPVH